MKLALLETQAIQVALQEIPGVRLAYVFGSLARGQAGPRSDIDIAVLARHALSAHTILQLQLAIGRITGRSVDVVDLHGAGQAVLGEILRDGIRLIGDADAHADLATRTALDANDFFPYVQRTLAARRQAWIG